MSAACFVSPLSVAVNRGAAAPKVAASCVRATPTALFRLPGSGGGSPFGPGSMGSGVGKFFSFGSGSSNMGGSNNWGGSNNNNNNRGRNSGAGSSGSGGGSNPFAQLWAAYNAQLERFPIATKAMTSLIGFFLGDVLAQKFLGDKDAAIVWARVARMASFGFLIHGPTGHYFYSALDRLIVGTSPIKVASKVIIDQVFWAPIFTALFFSYLGFAEGKSVDDVINKIKNDTWTGVTTSWKFWPLAHTINFAFIPTSQRLLYVNTLQVGYNVILSILGNK